MGPGARRRWRWREKRRGGRWGENPRGRSGEEAMRERGAADPWNAVAVAEEGTAGARRGKRAFGWYACGGTVAGEE